MFDPGAIVAVLNRHEVRFHVIGGMAAMVRDLPVPATVDIDITPARDADNLERLAAAFDELELPGIDRRWSDVTRDPANCEPIKARWYWCGGGTREPFGWFD